MWLTFGRYKSPFEWAPQDTCMDPRPSRGPIQTAHSHAIRMPQRMRRSASFSPSPFAVLFGSPRKWDILHHLWNVQLEQKNSHSNPNSSIRNFFSLQILRFFPFSKWLILITRSLSALIISCVLQYCTFYWVGFGTWYGSSCFVFTLMVLDLGL
jgi:hypothetical protein